MRTAAAGQPERVRGGCARRAHGRAVRGGRGVTDITEATPPPTSAVRHASTHPATLWTFDGSIRGKHCEAVRGSHVDRLAERDGST